jgi:hypothetical protein
VRTDQKIALSTDSSLETPEEGWLYGAGLSGRDQDATTTSSVARK